MFQISPYLGMGINTGLGIFLTLRSFGLGGVRMTNSSLKKVKKTGKETITVLNKVHSAFGNIATGSLLVTGGILKMQMGLAKTTASAERAHRALSTLGWERSQYEKGFMSIQRDPNLIVGYEEGLKALYDFGSMEGMTPDRALPLLDITARIANSSPETTLESAKVAILQLYQAWGQHRPNVQEWIDEWKDSWGAAIKSNVVKSEQLAKALTRLGNSAALAGYPIQDTLGILAAGISTRYQSRPGFAGTGMMQVIDDTKHASKILGKDFTWQEDQLRKYGLRGEYLNTPLPMTVIADNISKMPGVKKIMDDKSLTDKDRYMMTAQFVQDLKKGFSKTGAQFMSSLIAGLPRVREAMEAEFGTLDKMVGLYTKGTLDWYLKQISISWAVFQDRMSGAIKENMVVELSWLNTATKYIADSVKKHEVGVAKTLSYTLIGAAVLALGNFVGFLLTSKFAKILLGPFILLFGAIFQGIFGIGFVELMKLIGVALAGVVVKIGTAIGSAFLPVILPVLAITGGILATIYGIKKLVDSKFWIENPEINKARFNSFEQLTRAHAAGIVSDHEYARFSHLNFGKTSVPVFSNLPFDYKNSPNFRPQDILRDSDSPFGNSLAADGEFHTRAIFAGIDVFGDDDVDSSPINSISGGPGALPPVGVKNENVFNIFPSEGMDEEGLARKTAEALESMQYDAWDNEITPHAQNYVDSGGMR